jgi:hypothetical protein
MFEKVSQAMSIRVNIPLPIRSMILFAIVAALSSSAFAQTQASTDINTGVTTMVATAKAEPAVMVPAAKEPFFSPKKSAPMPVGAGSNNHGYALFRGYFFSVNRSGGDPAEIDSNALGVTSAVTNFDYNWKSGYKAEVGWNWSSGWGLRASYFYTNQSAQVNRNGAAGAPFIISPRPLNVTFTGAADAGTLARFRERFQVHAIDVEGTYKWSNPAWTLLVSGGVRVAPSRQTYTAEDTFAHTTENVVYKQERTGWGPTWALEYRHKLTPHLWWSAAGRLAVLFGNIDETSSYSAGGFTQTAARTSSRTNWVYEVESGLEWVTPFDGGKEFFINGSFMYHNWNDIVNIMPVPAVGASATLSLDNPLLPPTRKGSISFTGGVFSVGFRF